MVYGACATCHIEGGSGPFPLTNYAEVKRRARQIAEVTTSRFMPPWKPAPGHGEFVGERRLTGDEVALISAWYEAGAPEGDPADLPPPPPPLVDGWQLGAPDVIVEMPAPYMVPAEGSDDWRCFAMPLSMPEDRYVEAVEFLPSNRRVVHHLIMYIDTLRAALEADEADEGVGYSGMVVLSELGSGELDGWGPGFTPRRLPEGAGWPLAKEAVVVLDTHFQPTGKPEPITIRVGFHLSPPGVKTPLTPLGFLRLAAGAINILPGDADYTVTDEIVLPVDAKAVGILPHAHLVCQRVKCDAELPDGSVVPLLRIDDWDFNWQDLYRYAAPVPLPAGTRVSMAFSFDNTSANGQNPHNPPRRVVSGPGALDEMAVLWLQVIVDDEPALAVLQATAEAQAAGHWERTARIENYWATMVERFDANADGSLDADEEEACARYLDAFMEDAETAYAGFDLDRNGELSEDELQEMERILAIWRGE